MDESDEPKESEPQRTRRLLQALELSPPTFAESRRSICLRYVLSPLPPNSNAVRLEVQGAKISARGEVGAYRVLDGPPHEREIDETDRVAVAVLIEAPVRQGNSYSYMARRAQFALSPPLQRLLLPNLARGQRLFFTAEDFDSMAPVILDEGQSWNFRIDVDSARDGIELEGALERTGERIPSSEVACVLGGGFAIGMIARAAQSRGLSARAVQSLRRVARTLADLDDKDAIDTKHYAQALGLRASIT